MATYLYRLKLLYSSSELHTGGLLSVKACATVAQRQTKLKRLTGLPKTKAQDRELVWMVT